MGFWREETSATTVHVVEIESGAPYGRDMYVFANADDARHFAEAHGASQAEGLPLEYDVIDREEASKRIAEAEREAPQ